MDEGSEDPLVVAAGYGPEVLFLDAVHGSIRRTLTLQGYGHVNCLAVTPGGPRRLAVAGMPRVCEFEVQGAPSSEPVRCYTGHKGNVTAVGFAVDARWLYTGSEDGTMRVWDSRVAECQLCFENEGAFERPAIHGVDLHPNQVELIAGDNQGRVLVWDLVANRTRHTLIPEEGVPVRSVAISPDAGVAVCANHEGTCYIWQLVEDTFDPLQKIDAHSAYVLKCLFSPEAKHLVTLSADSTAILWKAHAEGFARCHALAGHKRWVWDGVFSSDGQYLITASSDLSCILWDIRSGAQRFTFSGFKRGVTSVTLLNA